MMQELVYIQHTVFPSLMQGLGVSMLLILPSAICGLCLGVVAGTLQVFGSPMTRILVNGYVLIFRGFPLIIQLYIWYFGLARIGLFLSPYTASVLGFSLCSAAYHCEYIRGALLSIKHGQTAAAHALGFTRLQTLVSIILPQAMRRALPGCGNEIIYLIKYSSLAYMVTCIELTGKAKILASASFKYIEVFTIVGAVYLFLVTLASLLLNRLETRLVVPGFERYKS
jgi:polar amino acid transport system permease protein